jgi:hypothetical protein
VALLWGGDPLILPPLWAGCFCLTGKSSPFSEFVALWIWVCFFIFILASCFVQSSKGSRAQGSITLNLSPWLADKPWLVPYTWQLLTSHLSSEEPLHLVQVCCGGTQAGALGQTCPTLFWLQVLGHGLSFTLGPLPSACQRNLKRWRGRIISKDYIIFNPGAFSWSTRTVRTLSKFWDYCWVSSRKIPVFLLLTGERVWVYNVPTVHPILCFRGNPVG